MNKLLRCIILMVFLFTTTPFTFAQEKDDDGEWYPFYFPEKLDPDSPYNVGKLVLDAPAGKHGFVKVKDGHFYFEDGTRAKFWGTNLCFNACFPTHEQAEMLATRIAYFGFNAVRLHHMDYFFEPNGIFEDICPAYKNPQDKKTGVLSKKQLDRLDYLVYQLKIRGIYIDMNLLVARHFTKADGVVDADQLGMAAKPVSMFDPTLIKLQKQYAKDLLTHYNPYTKLRYCDDPCVAMVEITNENSIISGWKNNQLNGKFWGLKKGGIPDYYAKQLDTYWNDWLKTKYGTTENVKNAWASNKSAATSAKAPELPPISDWEIETHGTAQMLKNTISSNEVKLQITQITPTPWHLQYRIPIAIKSSVAYLLKFNASSSKNLSLGIVCQQNQAPWMNIGLNETVTLTPQTKCFEIPFTSTLDCENTKLAFLTGYDKGTITLNNVTITVISYDENENATNFHYQRFLYKFLKLRSQIEQNDITNFYIDLEKKYLNELLGFLQHELKTQSPITGISGLMNDEEIMLQQECDFLDKHIYWDGPQCPYNQLTRTDFRIHNKSMLQDPDWGMVKVFKTKQLAPNKPWTLTEWNHCYPNQYAYESPILMSIKASEYDWDAIFIFAFSHGWSKNPHFNAIDSYFDIIANPQKLILCSLGSLLFLNGGIKNVTLTHSALHIESNNVSGNINNGAFFKLKSGNDSLSISFSDVRNTASGWEKNKYNWGKQPVQLRTATAE